MHLQEKRELRIKNSTLETMSFTTAHHYPHDRHAERQSGRAAEVDLSVGKNPELRNLCGFFIPVVSAFDSVGENCAHQLPGWPVPT